MKIQSTWLGLAAIVAALVMPGCVSYAKYAQVADELARAQEQLAYCDDRVADMEELLASSNMNGVDPAVHDGVLSQLTELQQERARLEGLVADLRANSGDLNSAVTIAYNKDEGMVGYSAAGDVLFASGSTELTKAGREALDSVYRKLQDVDAMVRVDGHTDTDPINKTKDRFPRGNIQLGAERAIAVREYLISKGLSENKVYIASYGPYRPTASGSDAASKRQNRRVEIMIPVRSLG